MSVIESRAFKSGNSVAVRLPKELGIAAGTALVIEKVGDRVEIRTASDPVEEKRKLLALLAKIDETWAGVPDHPDRGRRQPIDFPDRRGLY